MEAAAGPLSTSPARRLSNFNVNDILSEMSVPDFYALFFLQNSATPFENTLLPKS
jgi:hypothetical protein